MHDMIYRQAAIDALCKVGCGSGYCGISCDDVKAIERLPSAQPEYYDYSDIDDVWEYYAEEQDIKLTDSAKQLKDAMWVGYRKGKQDAQPEQRWIPCSERLPEKEGWYITTVESEKTGRRRIENDLFAVDIALAHGHTPNKFCKDGYKQRTVAWMPFPEPYRKDGD